MSNHSITPDSIVDSSIFEKGGRYRFQEQCFLHFWKTQIFEKLAKKGRQVRYIDNVPSGVVKGGKNYDYKKGTGGDPGPLCAIPGPDPSRRNACVGIYEYNHIVPVISQNPAEVINQFGSYDGAELFFRLDSSILTQLKPEIELYKIYPQSDTTKEINTPSVRYKVPMALGENIGPSDEGMPSRADISSLEEIFHDQNVLGNVMLTDLSFRFAGKNVALLNTVENVRFTLAFSSFNLFNHVFRSTIEVPETADGKTVEWSYKDLISYSTRFNKSTKGGTATTKIDQDLKSNPNCYTNPEDFLNSALEEKIADVNPEYFEIQMSVRYNPDDIDWNMAEQAGSTTGSDTSMRLTAEERKQLETFLRNSAINLRLQFVAHTIKYNAKSSGADQELVIDFEYKAFIESSLNSEELDIFKLNEEEEKSAAKIELKLKEARELLIAVQRHKLTLGAIFGKENLIQEKFKAEANKKYTNLRNYLEKEVGDLSYLIWSPTMVAKVSGLASIIPTKGQLDMSDKEKRARQKFKRKHRMSGVDVRDFSLIKPGLEKGGDLDSVLASTGNAQAVFSELVNHIRNYLKTYRRNKIQEKYKNLIHFLYQLERVYAVNIDDAEQHLGLTLGGSSDDPVKQKTELEMSRRRQEIKAKDKFSAFTPGTVAVAHPHSSYKSSFNKVNDAAKKMSASIQKATGYNTKENTAEGMAEKLKNVLKGDQLSRPSEVDGSGAVVYFTNLGDIIDVAIAIASYPDYGLFKNRIGILLGPLLEDSPMGSSINTKSALFNLAWVPISIKSLIGFIARKVMVSSRERYLLSDFIKDIIEDLILPALGSRCVEDALEGNQQVGTVTFTSEMREIDLPTNASGLQKKQWIPPFYPSAASLGKGVTSPPWAGKYYPTHFGGPHPFHWIQDSIVVNSKWRYSTKFPEGSTKNLTSVAPGTPLHEQFNYMFIYVNNYSPTRLRAENEKENIKNGVYYLHLGKIPSIARGATFKKENITYLREARAMGQITRTGGMALRDVYRFSCSMYGNNIFKPGMLFFVDPTKDGSATYEEWKDLGIGGFYRVIDTTHAVNSGGDPSHVTNITAVWETFGSCVDDKSGLIDTTYINILFSEVIGRDFNKRWGKTSERSWGKDKAAPGSDLPPHKDRSGTPE